MSKYTSLFNYDRYSKHIIYPFRNKQHEIEVCENFIWYHRYRYYVMDDPEIPDHLYDILERRLRMLLDGNVPENSPLNTVGSSDPKSYPENIQKYFENHMKLFKLSDC